jgi:hypothetical protein
MRLRIAILISTRLVIPRIVASEMDSHNIGTPNRVSKFS